jgi:hypothetical protein
MYESKKANKLARAQAESVNEDLSKLLEATAPGVVVEEHPVEAG